MLESAGRSWAEAGQVVKQCCKNNDCKTSLGSKFMGLHVIYSALDPVAEARRAAEAIGEEVDIVRMNPHSLNISKQRDISYYT